MKKLLLIPILTLFCLTLCFSQDVITKRNGEDIIAKVLDVGETTVKYKLSDSLSDSIYSISTLDLIMIRFKDGTKDIFIVDNSTKDTSSLPKSPSEYFEKGQSDAKEYYKDYSNAATAVLATSAVSPIIGIIPAVVCSLTKPRDKNLNYPDSELMKNPLYNKGYTKKALKIKRGKIWTSWGIIAGTEVAIGIIYAIIFLSY